MTRDEAISIARQYAKAYPQSYYSEPFQPHEWVIKAIQQAAHTPETGCGAQVVKFVDQKELAHARDVLSAVEIPPAIDYHGLCNRLAEVFNTDDTPDELSTEAREAIEALWKERDELRGHIKTLLSPSVKASCVASPESILDRKVTVCDSCLCACCWLGDFYCDNAKGAGTVDKTIRELYQINAAGVREDSGYWFKDPNTGKVDYDAKSAAKRAWNAVNGGPQHE